MFGCQREKQKPLKFSELDNVKKFFRPDRLLSEIHSELFFNRTIFN